MKLAIVGTGLIGASFAKAARRRGLSDDIAGLDTNAENAAAALRLGLIDRVVDAVPRDAAAVLLAVPVDGIADWVRRLADHPGTLFDAGSVKAPIIDSLRAGDSARCHRATCPAIPSPVPNAAAPKPPTATSSPGARPC